MLATGGEHQIDICDELAARTRACRREGRGLWHRYVVDRDPLSELVHGVRVSAPAHDEDNAENKSAHESQQCSQRAAEPRRAIAYFRSAAASAA
jgi:hypothetical protein